MNGDKKVMEAVDAKYRLIATLNSCLSEIDTICQENIELKNALYKTKKDRNWIKLMVVLLLSGLVAMVTSVLFDAHQIKIPGYILILYSLLVCFSSAYIHLIIDKLFFGR